MKKESAQIIYLNGPSSSGKTTLAKALQHRFEEPFLHVGIDKIIGCMPEKVNDWTGGEAPIGYSWKKSEDEFGNPIQELQIGSYAKKIGKTFQEVILALAKMGHHIIIDDVSFGKQQLDEWKEILKDFRVLWVGVNAPLAVLEQREKERGNRIQGSARGQFHKVHVDATYDLEINTHQASIDENAQNIKDLALSLSHPRLMRDLHQPIIRSFKPQDIEVLANLYFPWTSHKETLEKWSQNFKEQHEGIRLSCIIEYQDKIAGYGSLLRYSEYPIFRDKNIPEINDVWVYDQYRKKGFGTCLIDHLEKLAQNEQYAQIGIGVGLYRDYGAAQKLYFQLGYKPDGQGITYKGKMGIPGESYPLDDDLILWLVKSLTG